METLYRTVYVFVLARMTLMTMGFLPETSTFSKRLTDRSYQRFADSTLSRCHKECLGRSSCLSYNYFRIGTYCELNDADVTTDGELLRKAPGHLFNQKSNWEQKEVHTGCSACPPISVCQEKDNNVMCDIIECKRPVAQRGYIVLGNKFTVGNTLKYVCAPGYTATGSQPRITCQSDGKWSSSDFLCRVHGHIFTYEQGSTVNPLECWEGTSSGEKCYKNPAAFLEWSTFGMIKMILHNTTGGTQEICFDGEGSSTTNWFSKSRYSSGLEDWCGNCVFSIENNAKGSYFEIRSQSDGGSFHILDKGHWELHNYTGCGSNSPLVTEDTLTGRCYKFNSPSDTWSDAVARCDMDGWYLTDINTATEADTIYNLALDRSDFPVWIGGRQYSGVFTWVDGTTVNDALVNWADDQPSPNQDCISMVIDPAFAHPGLEAKQTDNENCGIQHSSICEKEAFSQILKMEIYAFLESS